MKKILFVALFALTAGAGVLAVSAQNEKLDPDSLIARNIEALGQGEIDGGEKTPFESAWPYAGKCLNETWYPCVD